MPKKTKGRGFSWNIYLPADQAWLQEEIAHIAQEERRSVSEVLIRIIEAHLTARGLKKPLAAPGALSQERPEWIDEKVPDSDAQ